MPHLEEKWEHKGVKRKWQGIWTKLGKRMKIKRKIYMKRNLKQNKPVEEEKEVGWSNYRDCRNLSFSDQCCDRLNVLHRGL